MSEYRIWFKVNGYDEIELPVNPQEVTITYPGNPTNYDVEGLGEIIIPRIPKLATLTFESFFPKESVWLPMANSDSWYPPEWYVNFFRNVQKKRQPFELTIVRNFNDQAVRSVVSNNSEETTAAPFYTVFDKAVMLDFSISDKGGEPGDVYYTMSVSEYRDASPKTLAELAEETTNEDGEVVSQKMVMVVNRPQQEGMIVPDRPVQITGNVYQSEDTPKDQWLLSKAKANQIDRIVTRVLPPAASGLLHSVYVQGLGWVDKGSCKLAENAGTINGINRLVTKDYD